MSLLYGGLFPNDVTAEPTTGPVVCCLQPGDCALLADTAIEVCLALSVLLRG
jgi:hypothetical protein